MDFTVDRHEVMHLEKKNLSYVYMVMTSELILNLVKEILKQQSWQFSESLSQRAGAAKKACKILVTTRMDAVDEKGCHFAAVQKLCCARTESCVSFCSLHLKEGCNEVGEGAEKDS